MYKHILIATDGSELSGKGLEAGLALAKGSGARVTVLIVSEPFPAYDLATKFGFLRDERAVDSYNDSCRKLADRVLGDAAEAAKAAGVACETVHVENSGPAGAILDTAKDLGADLVVLTSHGRHGLERFMLGSQAARVVHGAETSVLVVR